ncbi:hypothetical protein ScPMuIL_016915 [Solemya velum]
MGRGCACRFLYGSETDEKAKEKIDDALESKKELKSEVYLYKKSGSPYWCLLDIVPIKNEKSQVVLFLVSHKDITRDKGSTLEPPPEKESSEDNTSDDDAEEEQYRARARRCEMNLHGDFRYQRRRSRAVLYQLSGQFGKQNKAKSKLQQFNKNLHSISGKMPEYKVQEVTKSPFIIVHYGIFKIGWDWLILLCTFYTAIMVPFNAAFITIHGGSRSSIYSDVVVEILFILDIVLNFRTSFVNKSGQVVYDARQIVINYIKGWFLLDLLAAIPFDFLYVFKISTNTPVHLLKVARLLRLARLLQKLDRYSQYSAMVVALLMSMFALLAHWLACVWYAIGNEELNSSPPNWTVGWLFELSERIDQPMNYNRSNKPDLITSYITALYFTCSSLTSVGFGNVSANTNIEKIFSVCAMLVGAMMHAVVFGNVTAIIQRMYARRQIYHSKTKDLKDFFRTHHIPKHLKHRMQDYFQTMWSMNNGIDTNEILKDFPEEMRGEIGLTLHKDILSLPIFENATQGCLKSVSIQTRRAFCAPAEALVHKGDAVNYVYLLCSGSMEILKEDMVVAILGKGDLFGIDINFDDPVVISCCDVRSLTYCELQCIHIKGLLDVLNLYPEFAEKFCQDIKHDLTYNLREGSDESEDDEAPTGRVMNLPSISEDEEEEEASDNEKDKKMDDSDNEESEDSERDHLLSSPALVINKPAFTYLPNGDIDQLKKYFDFKLRVLCLIPFDQRVPQSPFFPKPHRQLKRMASNNSHHTKRMSLREKARPLFRTDSKHGIEQLSVSLQNLQTEVEGTKSGLKHLEMKLEGIGNEVSNINQSLQSIVKILSSFPSTPVSSVPPTPFSPSVIPHFLYGSPSSEEDSRDTLSKNSPITGDFPLAKSPVNFRPSPQDTIIPACMGNCHSNFIDEFHLHENVPKTLPLKLNKCSEHLVVSDSNVLLKPHANLSRSNSDGLANSLLHRISGLPNGNEGRLPMTTNPKCDVKERNAKVKFNSKSVWNTEQSGNTISCDIQPTLETMIVETTDL